MAILLALIGLVLFCGRVWYDINHLQTQSPSTGDLVYFGLALLCWVVAGAISGGYKNR